MNSTTLLFGNGLGRAINNEYFKLSTALERSLDSVWFVDDTDRELMKDCLPAGSNFASIEEDHLETLHNVSGACLSLSKMSRTPSLFLTKPAIKLQNSVNKWISSVGWHFHDHGHENDAAFCTFTNRMAKFIKEYHTHVATLNYDDLLYKRLFNSKILKGINGHLVDGFLKDENGDLSFSDRNFEIGQRPLGYYLHLHGSPLYLTNMKGNILKQSLHSVRQISSQPHLVLHHVRQKENVISNSPLLRAYWQRFDRALFESDMLLVVGYGGGDIHLNERVASRANDKGLEIFTVVVVERKQEGTETERKKIWKQLFRTKNIELIQLDSILDFDFGIPD